jgi:prepilin-type processing-associated H-X9-DG protein
VASAAAQPPDEPAPGAPPAKTIVPSSPYLTLSEFIRGYNTSNWQLSRDAIEGAERNIAELEKIGAEMAKARGTLRLDYKDTRLAEEGENASMNLTVHAENHLGLMMDWHESLRFHRGDDGIWRLRSSEPHSLVDWNAADSYLQRLIMLIAHPETRVIPSQQQSANQVKQLLLGVLQFVQVYNQKFAFTQGTFKEAIKPFIKTEEIWTAPGDVAGVQSYAFNPNLIGLRDGRFVDPAKTVMIYLGHDGKPDFRYDGKTVIGFVDGHAEILDAEQAKNLRWEP